MLESALAASCIPCQDDALNERSSMPPVSVTMQPRNLPVVAALVLDALLDVLLDEAELWLLPHAAMSSVADTASAAVAHALRFTLTSTGPARYGAWPRIRPGLPRRLFLVVAAVKGTRGYLACSLPNRNPILMASLAYQTYAPGLHRRSWCLPPSQPVSKPAGFKPAEPRG